MHVAKIVKSGASFTVEMPEGLDLTEGEFEVRLEGRDLRLCRVKPPPPVEEQWAWLDSLTPLDDDFVSIMEQIEAEDTAMAGTMKPPSIG